MELAKGVRDFPPEVQIIREDLIQRIRTTFERYGFNPLATPAIEREETLTFKFEGDEDVMSELFRLSDQGKRKLGLRFDLTVPLCRFVAQNKDLKFPFKRYEIGRIYRDGPIKLGRYREFWQCDADIIGSPTMLADAECVKCLCDFFSGLHFPFVIKINNRKILDAILDSLQITEKHKAIVAIDKLAKQGQDSIRKELASVATNEQIDQLFTILLPEGTNQGRLKVIEEHVGSCEGVTEMRELLSHLKGFAHIEFDPSLARGLNYYTGTVYEAFFLENPITSSVAAGGRYNNIIGQMMGGKNTVPAVGISIGLEPITDAMLAEKQRFDKTKVQVFVIPIKTTHNAAKVVDKLRTKGVNAEIDLMDRSISKNLDYVNKMGIPLAIIIGEKELQKKEVSVKNMRTGEETTVTLADLDTFKVADYL